MFKPIWGIIAFISLLLLITPFARVYQTNIVFTLGIVAAASYAAGVWIMIALRDSGGTAIFIKNSMRKSRESGVIMSTNDSTTGKLAAMSAYPYGGFIASVPPKLGLADKSLAVFPSSAIEKLSEFTDIIYSYMSPLKDARAIKSLMSLYGDSAEASVGISFKTGKKSTSEAMFGYQNGLIAPVTTDMLHEQQRMIKSKGELIDMLERSEKGEDSNREELERMIKVAKRGSTKTDKMKTFIFGEPKTDTENDKPSQREPQG